MAGVGLEVPIQAENAQQFRDILAWRITEQLKALHASVAGMQVDGRSHGDGMRYAYWDVLRMIGIAEE